MTTERASNPVGGPTERIGRYEVIRKIATGGMAELYLARFHGPGGFEKRCALKRILPQFASDEKFTRMFLNEARVTAMFDHPNLVQIFELGEDDKGQFFIAMELINGLNLRQLLHMCMEKGLIIPPELAAFMMAQALDGLAYAHEFKDPETGEPLNLVHRDISPQNILVSFEGAVKLVDFGIVKGASISSETQAGMLKGKASYMSPEQCRSGAIDRRSDVFSIGILLYELTVGRRLFQAETEFAIISKITSGGFPPPTSVHANYPAELEAIVMRALQLTPQARYNTARELQIELEEFAREYKLSISSARLANFMEDLFDDEARKWPTNPSITDHPNPPAPAGAVPRTPAPPRQTSEYAAARDEYSHPTHHDTGQLSPPHATAPPDNGLAAFDDALSKLLSGDGDAEDLTQGLGDPSKQKGDRLGIDLDNLEIEDLDPSKFGE